MASKRARRCSRCKQADATKAYGMCDPCGAAAAVEANGGAKCTDPVIHDRVAAALWPRHERN